MVPASAISFPEVRRLELIEHGFMSQIDICGVLDSCSHEAQITQPCYNVCYNVVTTSDVVTYYNVVTTFAFMLQRNDSL